MRIWTEAAKQAQREAIKLWKPWAKSTGPRTPAGKTRSAHNARKHDRSSIKGLRMINAALSAQTRSRKAAEAYFLWKNAEKSEKRTIMMAYLYSVFKAAERAFYQGLIDWCAIEDQEKAQKDAYFDPYIDKNIRMAA